jgi:hypothetical protein
VRREAVFRHGEVDRHEARSWPTQPVEQFPLMRKRLTQWLWQRRLRFVFWATRIRIGGGMLHPSWVKAMEARLRHNHRPIGMTAACLLQRMQHHMLNRVRHLHRDQHEVRLTLTPRNVARGIVARLSKSARIEKPKQRGFGRHVVECCGSRTGFEPLPDLGARVACKRGDHRRLACASLPQQPHDQRDALGALPCTLRIGGAPSADIAEHRFAYGGPEPVEKPHDVT